MPRTPSLQRNREHNIHQANPNLRPLRAGSALVANEAGGLDEDVGSGEDHADQGDCQQDHAECEGAPAPEWQGAIGQSL